MNLSQVPKGLHSSSHRSNGRKVLNGESLTYLNESGNFVTEEQWVTLDGTPQDIQETSQYLSVESFTSMIPELLTLKLGLFITL